jgi:carbamate kinase
MGPKIRAGVEFAEKSGREVLITSAEKLAQAMLGRAGTRIVPGPAAGGGRKRGRRHEEP